MTRLSNDTLRAITSMPVPDYDRSAITTGIVHFGVGNFHRAHQAMYLDRLLGGGAADGWGICGVGVLPTDERMRRVLGEQDGLYTLTLRHADGRLEARVIGSITEYLFAPDDPDAVIEKLADPTTRIVSLTVTEGGYNNHPITGEFDLDNEVIVEDAHSSTPSTVFGLVTAGLRRRRERGIPAFTVMSCDNIQANGHVACAAFVAFAGIADPELAEWIASEVRFPSSMVDRITPATTDTDRVLIDRRFDVEDGWPVLSEPFAQWVLEDDFALGRPAWHEVGVQLVADVMPYELMKLRLLNVGHQALAYFGYLTGYRFAHEAMTDPLIRGFVRRYMDEATPTLLPVPGIDLDSYKDRLIDRFSNSEVRDTLARLCADSSNRIPKWLMPVIRENLAQGRPVGLSAAIVASWARYAEGVDELGEPIEVVDAMRDQVQTAARAYPTDALAFLRQSTLFGDVVDDLRFTDSYRSVLDALHRIGARRALQGILATPLP